MHMILESNIINFVIAAALVLWFFIRFLPQSVKDRKLKLETELKEAVAAREAAEKKLQEIEERLSKSKTEAKKILNEAENLAKQVREEIIEEAKQKIANMEELAEENIESKRNLAMQSIKELVIETAIKLSEEYFKKLSNETQESQKMRTQVQEKFIKGLATLK